MKRSWQTFRLMHISLQVSELPDRLLSIIRAPKGERFISKVKYQPSAKKMVKPKQVITFVLLLERSDGFLLCGEDAQRAEDRASGFFWEHAHKENSEDYLLSAHLSTTHHKVFFSFLFIILQSPLQSSSSLQLFFIVIQHTLAAEVCNTNLLGFLESPKLLYIICYIHFVAN